jgi:hypothetical protein
VSIGLHCIEGAWRGKYLLPFHSVFPRCILSDADLYTSPVYGFDKRGPEWTAVRSIVMRTILRTQRYVTEPPHSDPVMSADLWQRTCIITITIIHLGWRVKLS